MRKIGYLGRRGGGKYRIIEGHVGHMRQMVNAGLLGLVD